MKAVDTLVDLAVVEKWRGLIRTHGKGKLLFCVHVRFSLGLNIAYCITFAPSGERELVRRAFGGNAQFVPACTGIPEKGLQRGRAEPFQP